MNLKEAMAKKLTKKEKEIFVSSFDIIGDIAVISIPEELISKEKLIGETLLNLHKSIKVVCKEVGIHRGIHRLQKVKIIAGERRKTTEYRESGVRMRLHIEKTYFSPRFGTERLRITSLIKKDEEVLVMFSGIAPFPLVITRNAHPKHVTAVEINPDAHQFAVENILLNKMEKKITLYNGDARLIVPTLKKFDRIVMPLPKGGENFLDVALGAIKKRGIIHFYDFLHEAELGLAKEKIKKACSLVKKKYRILKMVKCGQQGPRIFRIVVDVKIY